ncbi:MAG: polysaccharide biosynthesis protein [Bacilli bacterium]|nr:polysaccharide biosynthesis protein [Bacilli bacterium]
MKKNSFIQGAFIATMGIVLSKILGIIYVIPFYAIIGNQGGALYGYAYSIYSIFLGISSAGIPLAMSKIISEYNVLGYYNAKERAFSIGKKALTIMGVFSFLILMIFAKPLAILIIGNVEGGNSIQDITFVIRVISTAILIVPILSIYRGYLQGHRFITPTSVSQVLEQLVRVIIIVLGSYLSLKVFNLSLKTTVGISVFSATIGAIISWLYLVRKSNKHKELLEKNNTNTEEPFISDKQILRKILIYAFPFIMIDIFKSLYTSVDVVMLVKILVNDLSFKVTTAESVISIFSTWGSKLTMIVISIATGVMVSLIPNLTRSFVKNDIVDVRKKINQTIQVIIFLVLPMTVGLSILAQPVWDIFYGYSKLGTDVFSYYIYTALATTLFTATITITQVLKEYKVVFISLITGLLVKVIFNAPLVYGFHKLGIPAYHGATTATILGYLICVIICLAFLHSKYKVEYEDTLNKTIKIIVSVIIMSLVLLSMKFVIPLDQTNRLLNIPIILLYTIVGGGIFVLINLKNRVLVGIFGKELVNKFISKIIRKKR